MRHLLLEPQQEEVEGLHLLLYLEQDVRLAKRSWRSGADHRRMRWLEDEHFVLRWARATGLPQRLVAQGLTNREAENRVRQRFRLRRSGLLRGRPPSDARCKERMLDTVAEVLDDTPVDVLEGLTLRSLLLQAALYDFHRHRSDRAMDWAKYADARGAEMDPTLYSVAVDRLRKLPMPEGDRTLGDEARQRLEYAKALQIRRKK